MKIIATASPNADLPTELIEKVSSSRFAMISKWCPQQMILSHPVRLSIHIAAITTNPHSIGYRLVSKSLWTQQYSRSLIARETNVGNLSASKNVHKYTAELLGHLYLTNPETRPIFHFPSTSRFS